MVVQTRVDIMYEMRQSGATLDRVGSRFGITRERVRQLLTEHYGSTGVGELLPTAELCRLAGCTLNYVNKLKQGGVIQPAKVVGLGRALWKPETIATIIIEIDRRRCPVCHQPLSSDRLVYCSRQCYLEAHRYKNQPKEKKRQRNEGVKRWLEEHPEKARQIQQRKQTGYQARRSRQRYQTARYVIRKKCSIPLGTIVRIVSCNRAGGRMRVEWGEQIVEVPLCCVKRIDKEAVTAS